VKNKRAEKTSQVTIQIKRLYVGLIFLFVSMIAVALILMIPDKTVSTSEAEDKYKFQNEGNGSFVSLTGKVLCSFDLEIATTPEQIQTGLMHRDTLAPNQAMLFLFDNNEVRSFWMKNTYIPLDIIFISADSLVVSVNENTVPFSEQPISSKAPAKFVLEIRAGLAKRFGIEPGIKFTWKRH